MANLPEQELTKWENRPKTLTIKNDEGVQVLPDGRVCVVCDKYFSTTNASLLPRDVMEFFQHYDPSHYTRSAEDARMNILNALKQFFPTEFQGVRGFEIP